MKIFGKKLAGLVVAATVLTGCELSDLPFIDKPIVLPCPDYFVLEDAATLIQFRDGPGRDITDVMVSAQMGEMRLGCLSEIDNETNSGTLELDISPIALVEMGAANTESKGTLPYFVIVTDQDKKILYREELTLNVSFKGNRTRLVLTAPPTSLELPITPDIRSKYYRVYSGFVLTPEQVEFNRKRIRESLQ